MVLGSRGFGHRGVEERWEVDPERLWESRRRNSYRKRRARTVWKKKEDENEKERNNTLLEIAVSGHYRGESQCDHILVQSESAWANTHGE